MQISASTGVPTRRESEVYEGRLPLDGARILELGCGRAQLTRAIATTGRDRHLLALEVDAIQHGLNLAIDDLPNVRFDLAGAEAIPAAEGAFDVAFMFKSLHHVPAERMGDALREIARVLRPGGLAWISEPVYDGAFNDLIRLFHDEGRVRRLAFEAVRGAVEAGTLQLVEQIFFDVPVEFRDFAEFERLILGATHTRHSLSPETLAEVRAGFERQQTSEGVRFSQPMRVDLLRR